MGIYEEQNAQGKKRFFLENGVVFMHDSVGESVVVVKPDGDGGTITSTTTTYEMYDKENKARMDDFMGLVNGEGLKGTDPTANIKFTNEEIKHMFDNYIAPALRRSIDRWEETAPGARVPEGTHGAIGNDTLTEEERKIFLNAIMTPDPRDVINRAYGPTAGRSPGKKWHPWKALGLPGMMNTGFPMEQSHYLYETYALFLVVEGHLQNEIDEAGYDPVTTVEELAEAAKNNDLESLAAADITQKQEEKELTVSERLKFKQCALMTDLLYGWSGKVDEKGDNYITSTIHKANPSSTAAQHRGDADVETDGEFTAEDMRYFEMTPEERADADMVYRQPYLGRVLPIKPDGSENICKTFANAISTSTVSKGFFNPTDPSDYGPTTMTKKLQFIYAKDDGTLEKVNLTTNSSDQQENYNELWKYSRAAKVAGTSGRLASSKATTLGVNSLAGKSGQQIQEEMKKIRQKVIDGMAGMQYFLRETKIMFDGTNPSTARNDVQVSLTFELTSVSSLEAVIGTIKDGDGEEEIQLQNLVNLPITGRKGGGPGFAFRNQYSPNYNRLRLIVAAGSDETNNLILDLATIDHKISRDSETGLTTFEINYRGYFESMLAMPFNDALADEEIMQRRKERQDNLDSVLMPEDPNKKCDLNTVKEIMRVNQATISLEKAKLSHSSIIHRLALRNKLWRWSVKENLRANLSAGYFDPTEHYVKDISNAKYEDLGYTIRGAHGSSDTKVDPKIAIESAAIASAGQGGPDAEMGVISGGLRAGQCFYLGDLLEVVSDCLYKEGRASHREHSSGLNMKFMVGPLEIPIPGIDDTLKFNPCQIPIDMGVFVEWFMEEIVKKDRATVPVGEFVRMLMERLINDILYETCFSNLLPDESPPLMRSTYFSSTRRDFYKTYAGLLNANIPGETFLPRDINNKDKITNYCIIYCQFPGNSSTDPEEKRKTLLTDPTVPRMIYGLNWTDYNYLSNVSFSKTDSPYLREARYFNDSYGHLSLMANVYDLSFSFIDQKANTQLYPGMIIDFILKDWGDHGKFVDGEDSDPHKKATPANLLGFGGFYIIKSVEYTLGQTESDFQISVTSKFLGTAAKQDNTRTRREVTEIIAEDTGACIAAYNKAVRAHDELLEEGTFGEFATVIESSSGRVTAEKDGEIVRATEGTEEVIEEEEIPSYRIQVSEKVEEVFNELKKKAPAGWEGTTDKYYKTTVEVKNNVTGAPTTITISMNGNRDFKTGG